MCAAAGRAERAKRPPRGCCCRARTRMRARARLTGASRGNDRARAPRRQRCAAAAVAVTATSGASAAAATTGAAWRNSYSCRPPPDRSHTRAPPSADAVITRSRRSGDLISEIAAAWPDSDAAERTRPRARRSAARLRGRGRADRRYWRCGRLGTRGRALTAGGGSRGAARRAVRTGAGAAPRAPVDESLLPGICRRLLAAAAATVSVCPCWAAAGAPACEREAQPQAAGADAGAPVDRGKEAARWAPGGRARSPRAAQRVCPAFAEPGALRNSGRGRGREQSEQRGTAGPPRRGDWQRCARAPCNPPRQLVRRGASPLAARRLGRGQAPGVQKRERLFDKGRPYRCYRRRPGRRRWRRRAMRGSGRSRCRRRGARAARRHRARGAFGGVALVWWIPRVCWNENCAAMVYIKDACLQNKSVLHGQPLAGCLHYRMSIIVSIQIIQQAPVPCIWQRAVSSPVTSDCWRVGVRRHRCTAGSAELVCPGRVPTSRHPPLRL